MISKNLALFDFDGTITSKDTFIEIIKFIKGDVSFYSGMALLSPWLIAMKLRLISNTSAKERVLKYFFGNMDAAEFNGNCKKFFTQKTNSFIRPKAIERIKAHILNEDDVVIVSASPENWVQHWCHRFKSHCIATKLEVADNKITGKLYGPNCYGEEKVRRISNELDLSVYKEIICYGDSKGDLAMLSLGTKTYYKPFRNKND